MTVKNLTKYKTRQIVIYCMNETSEIASRVSSCYKNECNNSNAIGQFTALFAVIGLLLMGSDFQILENTSKYRLAIVGSATFEGE